MKIAHNTLKGYWKKIKGEIFSNLPPQFEVCSSRVGSGKPFLLSFSFRIVFLCNHEVEVGEPETADEELDEDCRVDFQWSTKLACPPHDQVT